ncbi:sugar transferase [Campylobacter sp. RM9344]|uniref:Sugar transferase n=1 Tax=Campylobacter californiensis TaxID=1032243 RepID=A0AAW3ZR91_9BACT|nr:sugar transferase [Campylobacter sp. RM6914]MBE2983874.1 sugar transferase [Campylobacter sp. RM6883]MBE2985522.1 sugar transferase [Campylobacter sp. RM12919]MBE2987449.1 sugar transferase [Campylobacter sp. RM12920]MBE2994412.1 sugar transferase [Campylobacter sp. RM6913]MBE3028720.1 sugar transferase [Campylobacter sp. RM9344]MBE3607609.1 sugar transferase [Campylobacter sp. RM9337]
MLILGNKYKFDQLDIDRLMFKFQNIDFVKYRDRPSREVRKELESLLEDKPYKYIVINTKASVDPKMIKYLTLLQFRLQHKRIKIITIERLLEKYLYKCYIPDDDRDLNFLSDIEPYNTIEYAMKRAIDYFGCIVLFLIHIVIKPYVKKKIAQQSAGALYFRQNRVGLNTKIFECLKFRTMHENSYHNPYTSKEDDRVFKFGNFMRQTRIDEIPQYKNILCGDMHLIGPRTEWDILVKNYEKEIPYYNERHIVRPGVTGWAQVNYPYGANSYDAKQKLMYDLYYIKHWSLWLEIRTIVKTILVIFGKKGL